MTTIPDTMKAVQMTAVSKLEDAHIPVPKPAAGEVLVKVAVSGVNPVDYKIVADVVGLGRPLPFVVGCDLSGTVVAVGEGVRDFSVGDEVMGMTGGIAQGPDGTLAEYAIAAEKMLAPKPKNLSHRQSAALPLALLTAWMGLVGQCHVKAGDKVLVIGASGGVGHFLTQIAAAFGAEVWGTGSPAKRDMVERFGAHFLDYHHPEQVDQAMKAHTANGFDIVYDTFGGEWLGRALVYAAPCGKVCTVNGFASDIALAPAALKNVAVYFTMVLVPFMFPSAEHNAWMGQMLRDAVPLIEAGKIVPVVDETNMHPFSAAGVEQTHKDLHEGKNKGKMIVEIAP